MTNLITLNPPQPGPPHPKPICFHSSLVAPSWAGSSSRSNSRLASLLETMLIAVSTPAISACLSLSASLTLVFISPVATSHLLVLEKTPSLISQRERYFGNLIYKKNLRSLSNTLCCLLTTATCETFSSLATSRTVRW